MGFQQQSLSLFNDVISAARFSTWVQTVDAFFNINLNSGQHITEASINLNVSVPAHIAEAKVTLYLNGSFLGDLTLPAFSPFGDNKTSQKPVSPSLIQDGKNKLSIKVDTGDPTASLDFTVTATLTFQTDTPNPVSTTLTGVSNVNNPPPDGKFDWKKAVLIVGVIAGVGVGGYLILGTKRGRGGVRTVFSRARSFRRKS